MLTSFFGKSKPVHLLILGGIIGLGFVWASFNNSALDFDAMNFIQLALLLCAIVFSVILLDFIVGKNHLTQTNAYAIFFYASFIVMLPVIFQNSEIIWANVFLLLALRRIISLRKDSNSKKKILDGAIWITVASIFYFWSFLFFIPLWVAIIRKPNLTFRETLIPIVGFFAVLLTNATFQLLANDTFIWFFSSKQPIGLDFSLYNFSEVLIPTTLVLTLLLFTWLIRITRMGSVSLKEKSNYMIFFTVVVASIAIAICTPQKDGSELMFLFAPTAILCANYIEGSDKRNYEKGDIAEYWFKEILLWIVCLFGLLFLFL